MAITNAAKAEAFDHLTSLHYDVLNTGVQAAERWLATPPEQRTGQHDQDPELVAATFAYESAKKFFAIAPEHDD